MAVAVSEGSLPVVLAFPHSSTFMPEGMRARLSEIGKTLSDTDWHLHELYEGLLPGASTVKAKFHRYVIDANRDLSGATLYPGRNTTGLAPLTDFDGRAIWLEGQAPDEAEIEERRAAFHAPYHAALKAELERVRDRHGIAVLYDCHSIRSNIPFLFEGELPEINIGTKHGTTCAPTLEKVVADEAAASGRTWVLNGRFVGGWTTRHYGRPEAGIHAIQVELAQRSHLAAEAPPFSLDAGRAGRLRKDLSSVLSRLARAADDLPR